jgi:hypothetical protein
MLLPLLIRSLYLIALLLTIGCETQTSNQRSRPTDEYEEIEGYLDSVERDVPIDLETRITIGDTSLLIPAGSAESNYRIRISRLESAPKLSPEAQLVLGNPKSDVVEVELFRNDQVLSSDDLLSNYEFSQTFATSESTSNIGLYVITDPGTSSARATLLPNSQISVQPYILALTGAASVRASVMLKPTRAIMWLMTYTDEALKTLELGTAESVRSAGGGTIQTGAIRRSTSTSNAKIVINSGASYTNSTSVTLSFTATGATQMYVTGTSGCASDGLWEDFNANKSWTLNTTNAVARVNAKFKNTSGSEWGCISTSIIHDSIPPSAPGSADDGASNQSLISSPSISWNGSDDGGSGVSHYEIAIGSSLGGTDIKDWTSVGNTTSGMVTGLSLSNNSTYYASVRAVDAAGNFSDPSQSNGWIATDSSITCPSNFVAIPANAELETPAFCVMKYEAKNVSGIATSQASLTPWVYIRGCSAFELRISSILGRDLSFTYGLA